MVDKKTGEHWSVSFSTEYDFGKIVTESYVKAYLSKPKFVGYALKLKPITKNKYHGKKGGDGVIGFNWIEKKKAYMSPVYGELQRRR